jgi:translocation and assembly module TamA
MAAAALLSGLAAAASAQATLEIAVTGGDAELEEALRAASLLVQAEDEGTDDPQELLAAARADYARLVAVLYEEGRFGGTVNILVNGREAAAIPPLNAPRAVSSVSIRVVPGPAYLFSRAELTPQAAGTVLPEGFAVGQPARTDVLREAVDRGVTAWRNQGHATATVSDQSLVVDHAIDRLAADIRIAPGPVVTFGNLVPRGYSRVRPERIVAIAGLPTGDTYSEAAIERAATRLRRTGTFRAVALTEGDSLGPGNTLDVEALVDEALPRRIGFGAEISSVDGLTLSGFWLHRNLLGGAERLRLEGEAAQLGSSGSGEDFSFSARFDRPATFHPDTDFYALANIEQLNEPSFTSQTGEIEAGFGHIFTPSVSAQAGLAYRYSRVTDAGGTDTYHLLALPIEGTVDRREDPLNPTGGYFANVELMPFLGLAGRAESGGRLTFDARYYQGLGAEDRVVLAGRLQGGAIVGASSDGVPDDYLFFSGGGGTVRGHEYQSLGVPVGGVQTGGRSFLGIQAEARVGVTRKLGLVAFADWGTVSADSVPGGAGQSHAGAGLGVRYNTPIGPVRLDLATPVSGPTKGQDVKIYIGIGQAF